MMNEYKIGEIVLTKLGKGTVKAYENRTGLSKVNNKIKITDEKEFNEGNLTDSNVYLNRRYTMRFVIQLDEPTNFSLYPNQVNPYMFEHEIKRIITNV